MEVTLGKMCRGDGFTYVVADFNNMVSSDLFGVTAESETGKSLPIECYELSSSGQNEHHFQRVLITPSFPTKEIVFHFHELNERGVVTSEVKKRLSRKAIKWRSRKNYRLHNSEMQTIRDVEKKYPRKDFSLLPFLVSEMGGEVVFKAIVRASKDGALDFKLFNSQGHLSDLGRFTVGATKKTVKNGSVLFETGVTVRLPRDFIGYLLVENEAIAVKTDECGGQQFNADHRVCMLYFDDRSIRYFLHRYDPHFYYTIANPNQYSRYAANQKRETEALLEQIKNCSGVFSDLPIEKEGRSIAFSIVVPLYRTPIRYFRIMYKSVLDQIYSNWELILVNASPDDRQLDQELATIQDSRVKIVMLQDNLGIAENTNVGIREAAGDYICFFDHDDVLEPTALWEYAQVISKKPNVDALYCDEDLLNERGEYLLPHFKSDFNLDLLRCHNYITHFLAVRSSIAKRLMLNHIYDGAQDYDFVLRVSEESHCIEHVAKVLYHWRMHAGSTAGNPDSKTYADESGRKALEDHLKRCNLPASVTKTKHPFVYHVNYQVIGNPLVSIIIPNKDNTEVLKRCIDSILGKTTYEKFEIVIVENNSTTSDIVEYYEQLKKHQNIKVVEWNSEFNYSAINNFGERFAKGDYLVLLNNDTEVIEPDWLSIMLSYCQRKDIGAVGARLLYPDDTVQHAGVFMKKCDNLDDAAGPNHVFMHVDKHDGGYMDRSLRPQDLSAVTAACMMTKRSVYEELDGFDEMFAVAYNDVDYCLRVRELGLNVVYVPDVQLYHYESLSRGADDEGSGTENYARFLSEQGLLRYRWSKYYAQGDPYYGKFATLRFQ